jgi:hypothetical protein
MGTLNQPGGGFTYNPANSQTGVILSLKSTISFFSANKTFAGRNRVLINTTNNLATFTTMLRENEIWICDSLFTFHWDYPQL